MSDKMIEINYFIIWINKALKLIAMSIDSEDVNMTIMQRIRKHWACFCQLFSLSLSVVGQIAWFVQGIILGKSLVELTFLAPCLTLCVLGEIRASMLFLYPGHIQEIIKMLNRLQAEKSNESQEISSEVSKWMNFLKNTLRYTLINLITGLACFGIAPVVLMVSYYLSTGKFKLLLPFLVLYPFDEHDIRIWPFVYFHQMWSGWIAIIALYAVDGLYFVYCTYISIQFLMLCHDMEQVTQSDDNSGLTFKAKFVLLIDRHRDIIRCIELLEIVYTKSTLFFVISSSLIICAGGFNLIALDSVALMAPYVPFLAFGFLEIFLFCYYGDYIMKLSQTVGEAVYNSDWYKLGAVERKYIFITLLRSQKPCRLTAYGFSVVNLRTFTRILSTSWSYFALLRQMFHK